MYESVTGKGILMDENATGKGNNRDKSAIWENIVRQQENHSR